MWEANFANGLANHSPNANPSSTKLLNDLVATWFGGKSGTLTEAQKNAIANVFSHMLGSFLRTSFSIECEKCCKDRGYVRWGSSVIHLCPDTIDGGSWFIAGTILHEVSHLAADADDNGYTEGDGVYEAPDFLFTITGGTHPAELDTEELIDNADTYMWVIQEYFKQWTIIQKRP